MTGNEKKKQLHLFHTSYFIPHTSARSGGFALVELLVAVIIFGIITTFVLLAYSKVSDQLFLTTLAYELALSFREAQSYGVSVHQFGTGASATFDVGYGLHFDANSSNTYALFADVGVDGFLNGSYGITYNQSGCINTTECLSVSRLEKGNAIQKFCGVRAADASEECSPSTTFLDVTFLRPNPDAIIKTSGSAPTVFYKAGRVYLISPKGNTRMVEVWNTGQISIK